ncbi:hypothetical protein HS048_31885 [Planomonospora sp. ID91781]|uniref:Uncharacterized protein n=1 Tax=Planomonospora sphaerica TaxID=161355 RepID=A0A171D043_9ACTN|nr:MULTISPECIES: hypothetical protein [Planomonospora]MBG0825292.1 hypothetical protein [Planomonospora sp. ID91781]GAT67489.1 hypothetical protein PS9374_03144 [Planomonospora sphaerica]
MAGEEPLTGLIGQTAVIAGMKALGTYGPAWASTMAKIQLAGKLAKPAAGAGAVWLLAQPWGDEQITKVWNDWRTVNLKLMHLRMREWDTKLKAVQDAWPEGADRRAFDRFMAVVFHEVIQTENAAAQMATSVQNAQSEIHKIVDNAGTVINALLGVIITSEIMQLIGSRMQAVGAANPTPAGAALVVKGKAIQSMAEATKDSSGLILMGTAVNAVVGATAALIFSLGNLSALMSADNQFPLPQANLDSDGTDGRTDFDDIRRRSVQQSGSEGWSRI